MSSHRGQYEHISNVLHGPDAPRWWSVPGLVRLNFFVSVVFVGQALNGFDDALVGSFQAYPAWHAALGYPSSSSIGLLNAASFIAGLCTAPFATWVADRWGRKWCVRYSALTALLATTIGSCAGLTSASGYPLFIVSRIIFGSGLAFCLMISPIMLQELPHPSHRVVAAGLFNTNYALGGFISAWLTFGCSYISSNWSWRIPYIVQIAPALYLLIAIQFVPETPRFLMSKGREQEALDFLVKYHGGGNPDDELVLFEFEEMKETLRKEKELRQSSWKEIVRSPANRHRMYIVLLIVSCQNLSGTAIIQYYYTNILDQVGITGATRQTGINAGLTGVVYFAAIGGVWIVNRVRRRTLLLTSWSALILVNICFTITAARYQLTGARSAGVANVAFLFFYDLVFFLVCGPLFFSYQTECLSYATRAKGMGLWGVVNKLISIFNAYVNSIALNAIGYKYYIVYTCILTAQLVGMYYLCVETSGLTLEEISTLFDGDKAGPTIAAESVEGGAHLEKRDKADATATVTAVDGDVSKE